MALGLLPAFFDKPQAMSFLEQNPNEEIELLLRKHPITNLPWIIISFIGLFLPILVLAADQSFNINFIATLPESLIVQFIVMYDLLVLAYAIESFLYWYFNIYIVTNQHLVEIDFNSLLNRDITEAQYDEIQTVTAQIQGAIREFFNFGTVQIETAAKDMPVEFTDVPQPDLVADRIRDIQQQVG